MGYCEVKFGSDHITSYQSIVKARKDIIKSGNALFGCIWIYDYSGLIGYVYYSDFKGMYYYHSVKNSKDYVLNKDGTLRKK